MSFPFERLRRLRQNQQFRRWIQETTLSVDHFVYPLFVRLGRRVRDEVSSMPGVFQLSVDGILKEMEEIQKLSIPAVLLFGVPDRKDEKGSSAYSSNGIVQKTLKVVKKEFPEILLITDVCLCSYTLHGHCGVLKKTKNGRTVSIDNDGTLPVLVKVAVSHAEAGADLVAPSAMMDGMVGSIREGLDQAGFGKVPIMSYSVKYASNFYGPFREAAHSAPQFGDRKTYQMDFSNLQEALREVALDVEEGADIIMVKPALAYLDVIRTIKSKWGVPLAAYHVSGEYSMIKAAARKNWLDEKETVLEILKASKRAGADIQISYWAKEAARWLR